MFKSSSFVLAFILAGCASKPVSEDLVHWQTDWPPNKEEIMSAFEEAQGAVRSHRKTGCTYVEDPKMPEQNYDYALGVRASDLYSVESKTINYEIADIPAGHPLYQVYKTIQPYKDKKSYLLFFRVHQGFRIGYYIIAQGKNCLAVTLGESIDN